MQFKDFAALAVAMGQPPPPPPPPRRIANRLRRNENFLKRHGRYVPPNFGINPLYDTGLPAEKICGKGYGGVSRHIAPQRKTPPFITWEEILPPHKIDRRQRQYRKTRRSPFDHSLFNGVRG